jgi:hypothetical protein
MYVTMIAKEASKFDRREKEGERGKKTPPSTESPHKLEKMDHGISFSTIAVPCEEEKKREREKTNPPPPPPPKENKKKE